MSRMRNAEARPDRPYLKYLLSQRNQYPERAAQIDEELRRAFERQVAILVLDMCGFSRLTEKCGIIHYLAMIQQMEEGACPAVEANGGQVIKQEADNLFATFGHPADALEAALDIFRGFGAINAVVPSERDIYGSIGIGYGPTLVIGNEDLFGLEMNLACKLGEDLAAPMEILLTESTYRTLPRSRYSCAPADFSIGGLTIRSSRFKECLFPHGHSNAAQKTR